MVIQTMPRAEEWSRYWGRGQTQAFTKISWSKRRIINIIQPYTLKGKNVLDAGCGSGFFSRYFCEQGMLVTSLDFSPEALDLTRQATGGRSRLIKGDLLSVDWAKDIGRKMDLIFTDGLFEHFARGDQDTIVRNLLAILAPRGLLITFVPNRFSPWEFIRPFYMPGIREDPFVMRELLELNKRNGLTVISQGGINTLPFVFSPDFLVSRWLGMLLFTVAYVQNT